jgi:hypothetical protein
MTITNKKKYLFPCPLSLGFELEFWARANACHFLQNLSLINSSLLRSMLPCQAEEFTFNADSDFKSEGTHISWAPTC